MKCPNCSNMENKVVDSRTNRDGDLTRRRRECLNCGERFTTYERIEKTPLLVVKQDGRREERHEPTPIKVSRGSRSVLHL